MPQSSLNRWQNGDKLSLKFGDKILQKNGVMVVWLRFVIEFYYLFGDKIVLDIINFCNNFYFKK